MPVLAVVDDSAAGHGASVGDTGGAMAGDDGAGDGWAGEEEVLDVVVLDDRAGGCVLDVNVVDMVLDAVT